MNQNDEQALITATARGNVPAAETRALIVLSAEERAPFLAGEALGKLQAVLPACELHFSPSSEADWHALLDRMRPEILIGFWSMPSLHSLPPDAWEQLKYVAYLGGSVRKKVPRSFVANGGLVTNWGPAAAPAVAECALGLILGCLRRFNRYSLEFHVDRVWNGPGTPPPLSLYGRRVGLHGFGNVARQLVNLLRPFGVAIEAWSDPVPPAVMQAVGVNRAPSLAALFSGNDIVVEIEGLTPKTRGTVTRQVLAGLRPGAVFVNVGRAGVVDYDALADRAERGDVAMGLDVHAQEPLPADSRFRGLHNVLLLPHIAGPTVDHYPALWQRLVANVEAFLRGQNPADLVTLEQYDNAT